MTSSMGAEPRDSVPVVVGAGQRHAGRESRRIFRLPDTTLATALVTGLLAFLVIGALLIRDHGDASRIVHAAPPSTNVATAPHSLTVRPLGQGYDGQFFYRLGVSPFSTAPEVSGVTFDVGALRNARWLSGALAWLLSAGHQAAVPWALLFINFVSAIALGAIAGSLARESGRRAGWGLLLVAYPGYAFTISLDTSELMASALLLGGLLAGRRCKWVVAGVLFVAAVLTRDTTFSIVAGIAAGGLLQLIRQRSADRGALFAGSAGVAVFLLWQGLQRSRFGAWPLSQSSKANVASPFSGLLHAVKADVLPTAGPVTFRLLSLVILIGVIVAGGCLLRRTTIPLYERVAWLPGALVVATLNAYLWGGATAFMRAGTEAYLMSMLVILGYRGRWAMAVAPPVVVLWILTIGSQIAKG